MKKLTEKEKIQRRWVRALRSGKYKQTTGALRKERQGKDGFCCLGVLCDLAVKAGVIGAPDFDAYDKTYDYDGESGNLPDSVMEWAGLSDDNGSLEEPIVQKLKGSTKRFNSLVDLNDDGKKTFKTIARIIESRPTGLFKE